MERPTVVQAFGHLMHNVGLFIPPTIHNRHSDANIHQCHWGDALPHTHTNTLVDAHKQFQTGAHMHAYTHDSTHHTRSAHTHKHLKTSASHAHFWTHTVAHKHP